MKRISEEAAKVLLAFVDAVDELIGVWDEIEEVMKEAGIDEPDKALERACEELRRADRERGAA